MDRKTIDGIIETFEDSYAARGKALYDKYKSVDKFVELSRGYVNFLDVDNFDKEIFNSYFENHVTSMYRRDFEKELLESEKNNNSPKIAHKIMGGMFWGVIGGLTAGTIVYVISHNIYLTAASSAIGSSIGLKILKSGGLDSEKVRLSQIKGTEEYEKNILEGLYSKMSLD